MRYIKKEKILKVLIEKMRKCFGPKLKKIIIFGSQARNDDQPGSDYDCLAIFENINKKINDDIDNIAGELLYKYNIVFSIFTISEKNFQRKKYNPLFINIKKEGIVL